MKISMSLDEGANVYNAQLFWFEIIYPIGNIQDGTKLFFIEGQHKDYLTGEILYKGLASKADREKIAEFFDMQGLNEHSYTLMRNMFAQDIETILGKVLDACIVFRTENIYVEQGRVVQGMPSLLNQFRYDSTVQIFFDKASFFFSEWCEEALNYLIKNSSYSQVIRQPDKPFEEYFLDLLSHRLREYWMFTEEIKFEKFKTQAKEYQLLEVDSKTQFAKGHPWIGHRAGSISFGPLVRKIYGTKES